MAENTCFKSFFLPRSTEKDDNLSTFILVHLKKGYKGAIHKNIKCLDDGINHIKSNHNNAKYLDDMTIGAFTYNVIKDYNKYNVGKTFILDDPTTETFKVYEIVSYPGYVYGESRDKKLVGEYEMIVDQSNQKRPLF